MSLTPIIGGPGFSRGRGVGANSPTVQNAVTDWGVVLNSTGAAAANTAALQAAIDSNLGPIYIPAGICYTSDVVTPTHNYWRIFGAGIGLTSIVGGVGKVILASQALFFNLDNITLRGTGVGTHSTYGLKVGVDGSTYTSHNFWLDKVQINYCDTGLYNGKADGSGAVGCVFQYNGINVVTDGNQDYFALLKCTLNDSANDSLQVLNGAGCISDGCLFANTAFTDNTKSAVHVSTGSYFQGIGTYFEFVGNGTTDSIYIYGEHDSTIGLVGPVFQSGLASLFLVSVQQGSLLTIQGGISANNVPTGGADILQNGTAIVKGYGTLMVANYNGIRNYAIGDFVAQSGDNSLPPATAANSGKKYFQMYASPYWTNPDEMWTCVNHAGTYAWRPMNLSTYDRIAEPHVVGLQWNNSGLVEVSAG